MRKAEELYMKHIYATGGSDNKQETPAMAEVMINEVDVPWKTSQYRHRPWRNRESSKISPNSNVLQRQPLRNRKSSKILPNSNVLQRQHRNPQGHIMKRIQLPRGSYTYILVNPTQLSDTEFTAWMDRLVEARRNRQENKPRPYRQFRKPFVQKGEELAESQEQQGLRNKLKPAEELNTEELMAHMRCEYAEIEEAVDMYNLDVEECRSA